MEEVKRFKSKDGKFFDSVEKCLSHEIDFTAVETVMSLLNPIPEDDHCKFANGHGFVRQDIALIEKCMGVVIKLADIDLKDKKEEILAHPFPYRNSVIGRYLSDSDKGFLYSAWHRFMCMDDSGREWGQPYFTAHPEAAEQFEIKIGAKSSAIHRPTAPGQH